MSEPYLLELSGAPSQTIPIQVLVLEQSLSFFILIIEPVVLHSFLFAKDMGSSVLENKSKLVKVSVTGVSLHD